MKTALHAPSPWTINRISRWHDGTPKDFDYLEVNSLENHRVAFAWDCKPKSLATISLISAAPDLLSALERLTEKIAFANAIQHSGTEIEPEDWSELYSLTNEARAVIAKAKGE